MFDRKWEKSGREIIKDVMEMTHTNKSALARRLGVSRQLLHELVNWQTDKHDLCADILAAALKECGFALIAIPMDYELGDPVFMVSGKNKMRSEKAKSCNKAR